MHLAAVSNCVRIGHNSEHDRPGRTRSADGRRSFLGSPAYRAAVLQPVQASRRAGMASCPGRSSAAAASLPGDQTAARAHPISSRPKILPGIPAHRAAVLQPVQASRHAGMASCPGRSSAAAASLARKNKFKKERITENENTRRKNRNLSQRESC